MAKVAITEKYLEDIADAIRAKTGLSNLYYPADMASAIMTISGGGGITPTGTISITSNGTYNVTQYASASVTVPTGSTILNQNKTVTPTESVQIVSYDSGYTGLEQVTVSAIDSGYVGSGITRNTSSDLTVSGATVTVPAGYYGNDAGASVASGTAGTPSASKGTVSNYSISVTPSVTNTTGYITGGTKTGTAVTVAASELVSGTKSISANGTNIDVTNYAKVDVSVPTGSTISNQDKTVNPSTSVQEVTYDSGYTGLGTVTVNAMPNMTLPTSATASAISEYTSKATIGRSTSDQYINIGTGYNAAGAYYKISAVPNGTAGTPSASKGTVSNHSISVTPSVTNTTGYITGSTKTGTAVTVSASELVSGNLSITSNGNNIDVTNYATVSVSVSSGGSVTQDQDGYIVLPSDGGGSPSVGGLVYETGTYTPTEDTVHPTINFINTHTERPFCVLMFDTSEELLDNNGVFGWYIASWYDVFGVGIKVTDDQLNYARTQTIYKTSASYTSSANNVTVLSGDDANVKMGYFIKTTGFSPYTGSTSRYWKTGRTYKWIAVWSPTT